MGPETFCGTFQSNLTHWQTAEKVVKYLYNVRRFIGIYDIFAVLYFAASQVEYAENSNTKAQSAQFTKTFNDNGAFMKYCSMIVNIQLYL